jgi:formamidopyrimidine-DNA glycosylase
LPDRSTRVTLQFEDGSHLYFNDQRKFGWMKLIPTVEVPEIDFMRRVGPEPLEDSFTAEQFVPRIRRRAGTSIKAALLDQTVLAGIGNIYADESLWGARVHPATLVRNVGDEQLAQLLVEIKTVLQLAIEKGGSTDRNYVNAEGKKGSYIDFARVFRREGLACPRCGATIVKSRVAARGTHTCPVCQPRGTTATKEREL